MTKKKIENIANNLDWSLSWDNDGSVKYVEFSKYSPYGQDFSFIVWYDNLEEIVEKIFEYYQNYDPSEEASYWLDDSGHGKNGAPYEMGDVYKDMKDCEEMVFELYQQLLNGE